MTTFFNFHEIPFLISLFVKKYTERERERVKKDIKSMLKFFLQLERQQATLKI